MRLHGGPSCDALDGKSAASLKGGGKLLCEYRTRADEI